MMNIEAMRRVAVAAGFAMVLVTQASAQVHSITDVEGAAKLEARAAAMVGSPDRFEEAAALYTRAAELRDLTDARRAENLAMAGRLLVYAGELEEGRRSLERAAEGALAAGDLGFAGNAWLDAAFIAMRAGAQADAARLVRTARWVAAAPELPGTEGARLRTRLAGRFASAQAGDGQ